MAKKITLGPEARQALLKGRKCFKQCRETDPRTEGKKHCA